MEHEREFKFLLNKIRRNRGIDFSPLELIKKVEEVLG